MGKVKVLFINYYFPPFAGGGVQRILKFVKYMPENGIIPHILFPDPRLTRFVVKDYSLLKEVPSQAVIHKSFIIDLNWLFKLLYGLKLHKLVDFISKHVLFPDYQAQWLPFAKRKIDGILRRHKIDCVVVSSPPHSVQYLGRYVLRKYKIPYVADYRDLMGFFLSKEAPSYMEKCRCEEKKLLESATFIIANTPYNYEYYQKLGIKKEKIGIIYNGYDEEDFQEERKKIPTEKTIFSFVGKLYGAHNALPFLRAWELFKGSNTIEQIELRFVGKITPQDRKYIGDHNLEPYVKDCGYVSHEEALRFQAQTDIFVVILSGQDWRPFIPGKIFEGMRSGKPILAVVPVDGSCAQLVRETQTGIVVEASDPTKIKRAIEDMLSFRKDYQPHWQSIKKFDRRNQAKELATILKETARKGIMQNLDVK